MNQIVDENRAEKRLWLRSGFLFGPVGTRMLALPWNLYAQSSLTVQASTGRADLGNTNP